MTNFERIKQLSEKDFTEWLVQTKCATRYCEETDGDCKECYTKWLNEVKKEFELINWLVKSLGEAQDGYVEATFSVKEIALLITALTEKTQREINSINIDEVKE